MSRASEAGDGRASSERSGRPPRRSRRWPTAPHAFELDNVRQPGAGVHPGAGAFVPALAVAEARKADGRALLTAFVAACEVMSRIGVAAGNSLERRGFHAPAANGTFGAAVAAGRLLGLDETKMTHALGIAGSYSGGLMEFSRCNEGAMIKRLHLGKAAEGGVTAALLASRGFAGPESILEGDFGFCRVFAESPNLQALTRRLGEEFETANICIKRYACHINAHAPIDALAAIREQTSFSPEEVEEIEVAGIEKIVTHHAISEPKDLMMAQYSIPFSVALSLFSDPMDPDSFSERALRNRRILELARRVRLALDGEIEERGWDRAARVTVRLRGGAVRSALVVHFKGTPQNPLTSSELEAKARILARAAGIEKKAERLFEAVDGLERLEDAAALGRLLTIDR
jgi:2-methylcitrate dehydratase PrpD